VLIPDELKDPYFSALRRLPSLVAAAAEREWDASFLSSALSAVAAAKGFGSVAEAVLEIEPQVVHEVVVFRSLADRD
jgi:hypothetical protein